MGMNEKIVEKILSHYDLRTLGYYVALRTLKAQDLSKQTKVSTGVCRKIEKSLADIGVIEIKGVGKEREILFPEEDYTDATKLLNFFLEKSKKKILTQSSWYQKQLDVAKDLIERFGLDESIWMVDYILRIEKVDMFSLNLVDSMAHKLLPRYKQFQENRKKIQEYKDDWDILPDVKKEANTEQVDLSTLLDFGIEV